MKKYILTSFFNIVLVLSCVPNKAHADFALSAPDFCNQDGPIGPLYGDKRQQVDMIRQQIDWGRSIIDNDRHSSDAYRQGIPDQHYNEHVRLGFEQRHECYERWRDNMEQLRANIESWPENHY